MIPSRIAQNPFVYLISLFLLSSSLFSFPFASYHKYGMITSICKDKCTHRKILEKGPSPMNKQRLVVKVGTSTLTQETISGGTSTSGYLIEAGQADVCRGQNAFSATVGFNGRPPYSSVNALFAAGGNSVCLQVTSKSFTNKTGYSTIEEIIENKYPARICSEDVGSSDYVLLNYIFEIYGIDAETFESWGGSITYTGNDTASEMMQDGSCDIICMASTLTSATITELSMSIDVNISGFNDKIVDGLLERGFAERYIPWEPSASLMKKPAPPISAPASSSARAWTKRWPTP